LKKKKNDIPRDACMVLVGIPGGERPLGRSRCQWVDNMGFMRRMGWYELESSGSG
jgi:hypothetical protein